MTRSNHMEVVKLIKCKSKRDLSVKVPQKVQRSKTKATLEIKTFKMSERFPPSGSGGSNPLLPAHHSYFHYWELVFFSFAVRRLMGRGGEFQMLPLPDVIDDTISDQVIRPSRFLLL